MSDSKQQEGATGHQLAGSIGSEGATSNQVFDELKKELKQLESQSLTITVFGASGHLARTKTIPAIFKLYSRGLLPDNTKIIGYARSKLGDSGFRDKVKPALTQKLLTANAEQLTPSMMCHEDSCDHPHHHDASSTTEAIRDKASDLVGTLAAHVLSDKSTETIKSLAEQNPATHAMQVQLFLQKMHYVDGQYDKAEDIQKLNKYLEELEGKFDGKGNRIFYLAIPPEIFGKVSKEIKEYATAKHGWTRVAVEKPFGRNQQEAKQLNDEIFENFKEDQIYRVDHFLGKDQVQQIPLLRFTNMLLDPLWNKEYISSVMIVFKEEPGVEGRGGYFDDYGIIRDVVQNHLLHIVAFLAMEPPTEYTIDGIRKAKSKAMYETEPIKMENIVVGQYTGGKTKDGKKQPSYREDPTTKDDSLATTFSCSVFYINNDRWKGVPFVIFTGKGLNESKSEARVQFKQPKDGKRLFKTAQRNEIVLDVAQSNIAAYMNIKAPGLVQTPIRTDLDLNPTSHDQLKHTMSAYERVVLDLMRGDRSLFVSAEEQDAMWRIVQPAIDTIEKEKIEPKFYEFGSGGPKEAADLLKKLDIEWSGDLKTL